MENKIRTLIVDDSFFIRTALKKMLNDSEIEVVGEAANGKEAVEKTVELKPHVITMDVEMPVMNGLEALKEIMKKTPTPVIMLSSLTAEGADATLKALELGAIDFIQKQGSLAEISKVKGELITKIKEIVKNPLIRSKFYVKAPSLKKDAPKRVFSLRKSKPPTVVKAALIGISTGGPAALKFVIPKLPAKTRAPLLIIQHMPAQFTKQFAKRLNAESKIGVKEAENGEKALPNWVYVAPGGKHLKLDKFGKIVIDDEPKNSLFKPSVNVAAESLLNMSPRHTLAIMMTGMGNDGAEGFKKLKEKGAYIVAQDPDDCVAWGMPSAVAEAGIADEIVPLKDIPDLITRMIGWK